MFMDAKGRANNSKGFGSVETGMTSFASAIKIAHSFCHLFPIKYFCGKIKRTIRLGELMDFNCPFLGNNKNKH